MDNKKRVALRVVFAARKAFLEYGAAVRLQAMWRGYFARPRGLAGVRMYRVRAVLLPVRVPIDR